MSTSINKIIDNLYVGNYNAAINNDIIKNLNISTIINCSKREERTTLNVNYLQIPIDDPPSQNDIYYINNNFFPITKFINDSINFNKSVLIHCKNGCQRSPTIACIYLMVKYDIDYKNAINFIKSKRKESFFGNINYSHSIIFVQSRLNQLKQLNQLNQYNINQTNHQTNHQISQIDQMNQMNQISQISQINQINKLDELDKSNGEMKDDNRTKELNLDDPNIYRKAIYEQNNILFSTGSFSDVASYESEKIFFDFNVLPLNDHCQDDNDNQSQDNNESNDDQCQNKLTILNNLRSTDASVSVMDIDFLEAGEMMIRNGMNPVILNLADYDFPNVENIQEQSLFCRSNYARSLELKKDFYSIRDTVGIYSPDVCIIRDKVFNILKNPYYISFIASSSIKNPELINNKFREQDYITTFMKIDTIFQIAYLKNHDSIILSAFGCDKKSNNPKDQIVEIFNKCLKKWKKCFKIIVFAVPSGDKFNDSYGYFKENISLD